MKKKEEENSSIFVPGLDKDVPVDQIVNINPDVDIRKAEYFILIHGTENIDYNKETKVFTRNLSTGHRSIEFIAKGKIDGHFGKYPVHGSPIDIAEIKDDSERYENGQKYDQRYGTSTVHTKIIPVTPEQYKEAFTQADTVQKSPGIFNVIDNNCNDFANNVLKPTGIKISDIYTEKELKAQGKLVDVNILANWGACDKPYQVTESILVNVADKYKVPQDRILSHPVDLSNPDVRIYTILPEGICPPKVVADNVISPNIRIPFLIEPPLKKQFIDILPKLYPKDYPVKFEDWTNQWGKQVVDRGDLETIKSHLPIYKEQLAKQKEFIDILPKLYPKDYPVKFEDWTTQWGKQVVDSGNIKAIEDNLPGYKKWLANKRELIEILPKLYPQSYPVKYEDWTNQYCKQQLDKGDYKTIEEELPVYKGQLAKQKEFINILPKLYPKDYPVKFEDWPSDIWGKQVVDSGNIKAIEDNLPGYKKWLANKRELIEILPKLHPQSYPVKYEDWTNQYCKQQLDKGDYKTIEESLPFYRKQLAEKLAIDPYLTDPVGYITSLMKGIMISNSFEQLKKQCKDAVRECLSKAQKQLAKFISDQAKEENKYLENIKGQIESEVAAANEKCRSKCDGKYSEYDAKVKAETAIKVANAQAAHAGHVGGCGCPSVIKNDEIVAKYQPIYDNFCKQYKEEAEKEIAEIGKKYQAMINGKGESIKESIYAKQEGINDAITSLADEINKILKDVATSINTGGTVNINLIGKQLEQSVAQFLEKAHNAVNTVTVMSVHHIEYDNPVLNHPELIKGMADKFGSGIINKLIDFGMQFINNQEDREILEGVCSGADSVDAMSLLMGLDVNHDVTYH